MLVLASNSPRRSEILKEAGFEFIVRTPNVSEDRHANEAPQAYVRRLAREKAWAVEAFPGEVVLGADTVVVIESQILGKPSDNTDAARM